MWALLKTQLPALLALVVPLAQLPLSSAAPNCPLIGPEFPAPYNLQSHPIWKAAIQNITNVFQFIDDTNITGVDLFSYSLQVFSTNPGSPILWERHRTARDLPANTTGVRKVDGNTVYRLGSVTKVFTVLTFLAEAGDVYWTTPITKFIPELAKFEGRSSRPDFDPVRETDWDDITIGALASQVSGLGRDCRATSFKKNWKSTDTDLVIDGVLGEFTETEDAPPAWQLGLPELSNSSLPPCGAWPLCTRERKETFDCAKAIMADVDYYRIL
jgi:hypothetical protein